VSYGPLSVTAGSAWRGRHVVLFVDRDGPYTAQGSGALTKALGIELRFLPAACPELNLLEELSWDFKNEIVTNEPTPGVDAAFERAWDDSLGMDPTARLQAACLMS
jgi:hypothetical protein